MTAFASFFCLDYMFVNAVTGSIQWNPETLSYRDPGVTNWFLGVTNWWFGSWGEGKK